MRGEDDQCMYCMGTKRCPRTDCKQGQVKLWQGNTYIGTIPCPTCAGTGKCVKCAGTGRSLRAATKIQT